MQRRPAVGGARISGMIRHTLLSTAMPDEDELTEPPSGMLKVTVIGDTAHLDWGPTNQVGECIDPPTCSFQVPARSLLLALRAAWDDNHPGAADLDHTRPGHTGPDHTEPVPARDRGSSRPPRSHQPWTPELDAALRDTWLATAATASAPAAVAEIAKAMGRSHLGIRSRLERLGCDPDSPGRTLPPDDPPPRP